MITGIPVRLGQMAVAAATVAALVSAGSAVAQTAGAAHTLRPAHAAVTTQPGGAPASPGGRPREHVPSPQVIGPVTGGLHHHPFTSSPVPLGLAGYTEQEFFVKGTATGYRQAGTWGSDGRWTARPAETAPYETRILVRRPADPARFNGTVVVEWLNVSFTIDVDPDFLYTNQKLVRAGYA